MAEVVRYVDPDASGAEDGTSWTDAYTSLSDWNTGEATNLVTDGDWHHVYCRSSSGTADTTAVTTSGWTTAAANYILIEAADGDQAVADGWDTSRYRIVSATGGIYNTVNFIRFKGLQIEPSGDFEGGIYLTEWSLEGSNDIRVDSCRIQAGDDDVWLLTGYSTEANVSIFNTILDGQGNNCNGVQTTGSSSAATYDFSNCIIANCGTGTGVYISDADTVTIENCAVFNTGNDFDVGSNVTIDYCASDDGDGTNDVSPDSSDWDNEFTDPDNGDFEPLDSGNIYHGGTAISGLTTDMAGEDWNDPPTIGVLEIVSGATPVTISATAAIEILGAAGLLPETTISPEAALEILGEAILSVDTPGVTISASGQLVINGEVILHPGVTVSPAGVLVIEGDASLDARTTLAPAATMDFEATFAPSSLASKISASASLIFYGSYIKRLVSATTGIIRYVFFKIFNRGIFGGRFR